MAHTDRPILYTCTGSRGLRATWEAEEAGTDIDLRLLPFPPRHQAPDYLELNPLGTVPMLVLGEVSMTESCAIAHYLATLGRNLSLVVDPAEAESGASETTSTEGGESSDAETSSSDGAPGCEEGCPPPGCGDGQSCPPWASCVMNDAGEESCVCDTGYQEADEGASCVRNDDCLTIRTLEVDHLGSPSCRIGSEVRGVGVGVAVDFCNGDAATPEELDGIEERFRVLTLVTIGARPPLARVRRSRISLN